MKGYKRLWMLRRLKQYGANSEKLLYVYIKQIRSALELAVPVWQSRFTMQEICDIERVQRAALNIILGYRYTSYKEALEWFNLDSLEDRMKRLCF